MSACMQVPSFDSQVAMSMIEQELGRPWQQVYAELTPRPIAAASLGQASAFHPPALLATLPNRAASWLTQFTIQFNCIFRGPTDCPI